MKLYLYEGLNKQDRASVLLWESAGRKLVEAQLTADQITQLFQQIEQGATAAGGNRTALGLTKDAGTAVMKAYNDLKTKVATSGPIQNLDTMYDQAAAKLKQATGGDQGVMQYVQKYRDFAKKHPVAQSLIYGALIAAAGISGAGAGGAAALGLLKMTDKLLQGEKFSSAAYSGAKTGALAYGASKLGDYMKGQSDATTTATTTVRMDGLGEVPADLGNYIAKNYPASEYTYKNDGMMLWVYDKATGAKAAMYELDPTLYESYTLTSNQVQALFEHIVIAEGLFDTFKTGGAVNTAFKKTSQQVGQGIRQGAAAIAQKAQTVGHNITTKTTADKLQSAWKRAGSPTDSEAIIDLLRAQGIDAGVIDGAMQAVNVAKVDRSRLPDVGKLNLQQKQQLLAQLDAIEKGAPVTKTPKPKVPYSAVQSAQPGKITAPPNPGAPTPQEYDKFQQKLQAAMQKQA